MRTALSLVFLLPSVAEWALPTPKFARFDPETRKFDGWMIVDAKGRLRYMGSHSGKLGVVE